MSRDGRRVRALGRVRGDQVRYQPKEAFGVPRWVAKSTFISPKTLVVALGQPKLSISVTTK